MNIEGFLLASGFALLIVLLGWASQITSKSKETTELERAFLAKAKVKREAYRKIIKEGGSTEDSFSAAIDFLYSTETENLEIFEKIKRVKEGLRTLDGKYRKRFWVLLFMSMTLFVCGLIGLFLPSKHKVCMIIPFLIFIVAVFWNLVQVHNLESKYIDDISEAMEKL